MTVRIVCGDALQELRRLPDESVHCCVTSPPYYGLRDYGVEGQLGLEATPDEYVAALVGVFREMRRVLRKDGTLWLNIGDSYAASWPCSRRSTIGAGSLPNGKREARPPRLGGDLKTKDLIGIPWMLAFALRADGWWLRQDIIWAKPNPMPESITDRCTKAHEYVFLLGKSERYYYDAAAIAEAAKEGSRAPSPRKSQHAAGGIVDQRTAAGFARGVTWGETRNKRSVWSIAAAPFPDAHFATFPPDLVEPCILAGCPKGGSVLDLFGGAGTTGLVADRLGRDAILIELNPAYAEIARRRIKADGGMFAEVV